MNDPLIYVVPTGLIRNAKMSGAKGIRGKEWCGKARFSLVKDALSWI